MIVNVTTVLTIWLGSFDTIETDMCMCACVRHFATAYEYAVWDNGDACGISTTIIVPMLRLKFVYRGLRASYTCWLILIKRVMLAKRIRNTRFIDSSHPLWVWNSCISMRLIVQVRERRIRLVDTSSNIVPRYARSRFILWKDWSWNYLCNIIYSFVKWTAPRVVQFFSNRLFLFSYHDTVHTMISIWAMPCFTVGSYSIQEMQYFCWYEHG